MNEYTVFPNAPINEALVDIRVELPKEIVLTNLESFHDLTKKRFPKKEVRISLEGGIKLSSKGEIETIPASGKTEGYLFKSQESGKIVQARLNGFTFNKLRPYKDWQTFSSEAHDLWNLYFQTFKPIKIIRIALRYINRIDIPLPINDLKEYILTVPEIAPKLPQTLDQFFMRLIILNSDIQAKAIITQTMGTPIEDQKIPLIFDIDVFQNAIYTDNKIEMWEEFEKLRIFKNDIFFNSITEKTRGLFE